MLELLFGKFPISQDECSEPDFAVIVQVGLGFLFEPALLVVESVIHDRVCAFCVEHDPALLILENNGHSFPGRIELQNVEQFKLESLSQSYYHNVVLVINALKTKAQVFGEVNESQIIRRGSIVAAVALFVSF